jgi:hypothetical protein
LDEDGSWVAGMGFPFGRPRQRRVHALQQHHRRPEHRQRCRRAPRQDHRQRQHRQRPVRARGKHHRSQNTASGSQALGFNTTGNKNTAFGIEALFNSIGNKNIAIGFKAGNTLTSGNNNIYLGNPGNGDESKTMRLGSVETSTFIAGIATAGVSGATVEIDANGQLVSAVIQ